MRISNDTHSVVVLSIVGDVVTIAEGNYNNSIHWGRTLSLTQLQNGGIDYGITRYPVEYSQELAGSCGDSWDGNNVICPKSQWSGTCGEGLTYRFDRNTGTLTITGIGEVAYDDAFGENVFAGYKAVKNIVLKDFAGTELPTCFHGWPNVEFFEIPEGVTCLDYNTFADCDSLKYVVVPASVENIRNSFWGNSDTFEIRGYTGTKIEAYAKKEGITFVRNVTCYDSLGNQVINEFKCDGTYTYYFQAAGTAMKDRLTYHPDGVQIIYFDSEGHEIFSDFANVKMTIEGKPVDDYCFFDVYGNLYVDVITYDKEGKKLYYDNPYGVMDRNKWFEFSDTVKWANGTPFDKAGGRYGCAAADGSLITNTWTYDWEGRFCYLQGNGVAVYY